MRKAVAVCLLVVLVVAALALPAAAGKKKRKKVTAPPAPVKVERVVEGTYKAPTLVAAGLCGQSDAVGCVAIASGPGEEYVSASVTDAHGQPVFVQVKADTNGDAADDVLYGTFCGKTDAPIKVDQGFEIHFWVGTAPDPDTAAAMAACAPGQATQGTLTATFSNLP